MSNPTETTTKTAANQVVTDELRRWIVEQAEAGCRPDDVLKAMQTAGWDEEVALDAMEETLRARLDELTEREREVLQRVASGRPNKLIADELGISVRTVEVHRARVFEKMDVKSAAELAQLLQQL